jgi:hypothetical protein
MTHINSIKKIGLFFWVVIFSTSLSAQTAHFLYIQSDNSQAFYVRLNNKVFSSSDVGFLIIPKLQSGKLSLIIGFPKNKWNAMNYDVNVESKDLSFQLKKVDSSNWELYDDLTKQMLVKNKTDQQQDVMEINNDEFSNVLAEVSDNPKIKQIRKAAPVIDSMNLKLETKINVVEHLDTNANTVAVEIVQTEKIKNKRSERKKDKQRIQKEFSFLDSTGNLIKYVIIDEGKSDTVSIFIPFTTVVKTDKNIPQQIPAVEIVQNEKSDLPKETAVKKPTINQATEKDFLQLRKQMILEESEDLMIDIAEKAFETTAYSTEMIKNLAVLFLKEKNKLNFLIRAYKYVSDKQNYNSLSTLLTEEKSLSQFNHLFE